MEPSETRELVPLALGVHRTSPEPLIGVLEGEGVGPEVVRATLGILQAASEASGVKFQIERGGAIGRAAETASGAALSPEVIRFCDGIFARGGAILAGPGGGRFVYDLRKRFDLFLKLNPIRPLPELARAGCVRPEHLANVDILVVREAIGGVYQGEWGEEALGERRVATHRFQYGESEVRRILVAAARLARARRGRLAVIHKESGVPSVSRLWTELGRDIAKAHGVEVGLLEVDFAAYALVRHAREFDVIAAPNLFGDVLSDLGGLLLGSRGIGCGASFSPRGEAVYQTNHGAAHDLAGKDRANPVAQVLSVALLLRESLGQPGPAARIEAGVRRVLADGYRTVDVAEAGAEIVGTRELGERIAAAVRSSVGEAA
jgi:3-isopropylmalate dehydrogenase